MTSLRRSAPYALLNRATPACVWGRLQANDTPSVKLATVWGAAGRTGDRVTVWCSNPPEASRLAATGQLPAERRGLRRILNAFSSQTVVHRHDLDDGDVVLAVLLALHPRGTDEWPADVLPQAIQTRLVTTVVQQRRVDGTTWRARDPRDADSVASLVCAMADAYREQPGASMQERMLELAERLPDSTQGCEEAARELAVRQVAAA